MPFLLIYVAYSPNPHHVYKKFLEKSTRTKIFTKLLLPRFPVEGHVVECCLPATGAERATGNILVTSDNLRTF